MNNSNSEIWRITSVEPEGKLVSDFTYSEYIKGENKEIKPQNCWQHMQSLNTNDLDIDSCNKIKPEVYQFKTLNKEQEKMMVNKYHQSTAKQLVSHPNSNIEGFDLRKEILESQEDGFKTSDTPVKLTEADISEFKSKTNDESLCLAGLIDKDKIKSIAPEHIILKTVSDCYCDMNLIFAHGILYVNKCPTIISEDDVRDLYNGMLAFTSYEEAVEMCVDVLKEKLAIFVKKKSQNE